MGGVKRKKIIFHPTTGNIDNEEISDEGKISEFLKLEKKYIEKIFKNKNKTGDSIIFE